MKRAFGGDSMKVAHAFAKRWAVSLFGVVIVGVCSFILFTPPVSAEPDPNAPVTLHGTWLNRQYIVDNRMVNFLDINTFDNDFSYVEETSERCPDIIQFQPKSNIARNIELFFFSQSKYNNSYDGYNPVLIVTKPTTNSANQPICTAPVTSPLTVNNPDARRITFYKDNRDGKNKIVSIFNSGIVFSQNPVKPAFKGIPRYFRDSEIADANNSCPDMILLHNAEPLAPPLIGGDTAEFIFGTGETPGSSMLFSVEKNSDLARTSETFKIDGELDNISETTCNIRGSAMDKKLTGEYAQYSNGDAGYDVMFMSAGLDQNGNTAQEHSKWKDDAFIIFIGDIDTNQPKDSTGKPIEEPPDPAGSNPDLVDKTICKGGGLGWIICPVAYIIQNVADLLRKAMEYFLSVNPLPIGSGPIYEAWNNIRNFANITFVIGFFAIILSQATSIGISNYGIKRLLPRLILVAIATNISYFLCSFAIDIFNILGVGVTNLLAVINGGSAGTINASNGAGLIFAGGLTTALVLAFTTGAIVQIFPIIIAAFLALLVVFFVLLARQALIILLVVISPLAFVAGLLPGTQQWLTRWTNLFIGMLVMYPMVMALFAASRLASSILSAVGS